MKIKKYARIYIKDGKNKVYLTKTIGEVSDTSYPEISTRYHFDANDPLPALFTKKEVIKLFDTTSISLLKPRIEINKYIIDSKGKVNLIKDMPLLTIKFSTFKKLRKKLLTMMPAMRVLRVPYQEGTKTDGGHIDDFLAIKVKKEKLGKYTRYAVDKNEKEILLVNTKDLIANVRLLLRSETYQKQALDLLETYDIGDIDQNYILIAMTFPFKESITFYANAADKLYSTIKREIHDI